MNTTAQILSETITEDRETVCFDGTDLFFLAPLREFFSSYNLTVVENDEAKTECLYWIICGDKETIAAIYEKRRKSAKGIILTVLNSTEKEAGALASLYSAKVARIAHKEITSADARVIFGLLFTESESAVTISEDILPVSPPKENKSFHNVEIMPISKKGEEQNTHVSWELAQRNVDSIMKKIYEKAPEQKSTKIRFRPARVFSSVFVVLSLFFLLHVFSLFAAAASLILASKYSSASTLFAAKYALAAASVSGSVITSPFHAFSLSTPIDPLYRIITRAEHILSVLYEAKTARVIASAEIEHTSAMTSLLQTNMNIFSSIKPDLSLIAAEVKMLAASDNILIRQPVVKEKLERILSSLDTIQEKGDVLFSFLSILPSFIDGKEKQTILLLFQNNRELRPTGGFIGSAGIVTIEKGSIESFEIYDVYDIDGQLKGHVDPPLPIRTLLSQEHWYLRDSNWSADFPTAAKKAALFVSGSIHIPVDAVVGISLPVVEDIINITGPIHIPELDKEVSADTVFEFIYSTTREEFFPGSSAKKDTLTRLADKLKQSVFSLDSSQMLYLASLMADHLQNRNIQFFSTDQIIQEQLEARGFSGKFPPQTACPQERNHSCLSDVFAVVEANVGMNKANSQVSRKAAREVRFEQSEIVRKDSLVFHVGKDDIQKGGGNYTSYMRFYYPVGTTVSSVVLNNSLLPIGEATMSAKPVPYAELVDELPGFITVGVAVDAKPESDQSLVVETRQSFTTTLRAYNVNVFKQAGVDAFPFTLTLEPPIGFKAASSLANKDKFTYNIKLRRDENILVLLDPEAQ